MELIDYEQRIGKSRHIEVKLICKCGKEYWAKWSRVKIGQGRYCSLKCANLDQNLGANKQYVGKENANTVFDKPKSRYYVYWFDPITLKRCTTSYARWWWEQNKGEISEGYRASYKDGNSLNIDPENICLISSEEFGKAVSKRLMGHTFSDETKKKMSEKKLGKPLSDEHKEHIGLATKKMWAKGVFDNQRTGRQKPIYKHRGEYKTKDEIQRNISMGMRKYHITHPETKINVSQKLQGKQFTLDHLENLSKAGKQRTDIKGENSRWWKGGIHQDKYPDEFNPYLKRKIKMRDGYICQSCGENVRGSKRGHVHHIDGNKSNCDVENLILLCATCHNAVHGRNTITNEKIKSLQSMLS